MIPVYRSRVVRRFWWKDLSQSLIQAAVVVVAPVISFQAVKRVVCPRTAEVRVQASGVAVFAVHAGPTSSLTGGLHQPLLMNGVDQRIFWV